jgi:hypothetical protein
MKTNKSAEEPKKKRLIFALLLGMATLAFAEGKPQKSCPVKGEKINKETYVDAEGYRIYVCCKECISEVKADPEKYIEKMKDEGVELEKAPKKK